MSVTNIEPAVGFRDIAQCDIDKRSGAEIPYDKLTAALRLEELLEDHLRLEYIFPLTGRATTVPASRRPRASTPGLYRHDGRRAKISAAQTGTLYEARLSRTWRGG